MSVAASRPSPLVAAPAPVAAPTPADREPAPHPFSELLRQNRQDLGRYGVHQDEHGQGGDGRHSVPRVDPRGGIPPSVPQRSP